MSSKFPISGSPAGPGGNGSRFLWRILYIYNIQAVKQARHGRRISELNMTPLVWVLFFSSLLKWQTKILSVTIVYSYIDTVIYDR
jgi:hypothetical protein